MHRKEVSINCRWTSRPLICVPSACCVVFRASHTSRWVLRSLSNLDTFKLLAKLLASIDLEQVLQLHAFVHVEYPLLVALIECLLFDLLLHCVDLGIAL